MLQQHINGHFVVVAAASTCGQRCAELVKGGGVGSGRKGWVGIVQDRNL